MKLFNIINENNTIGKAVSIFDTQKLQNLVIIDDNNIFKGSLKINDLRRLLISGANEFDKLKTYSFNKLSITIDDFSSKVKIQEFITSHNNELIVETTNNGEFIEAFDNMDLKQRYGVKIDKNEKKVASGRVLIIGGAGYLGSIITSKLLERNYNVRVLDCLLYGRRSTEYFKRMPNYELIIGDIRNIEVFIDVLDDVDYVILLAAIVGDPASVIRPSQTIQTNILATEVVANACKLKNINRFIYASTCSVYGLGQALLDEQSPLNPVSLYARTKIASEKSILSLGSGNFSPTILRLATLYGFSHRMRFDLVVNTMTLSSFLKKEITVYGGTQWRPLLHVEDAANAFVKVLESDIDLISGKIYNVGSEEQNFQIKVLAEKIQNTLRDIKVNYKTGEIDTRNYMVSFEKIRNELSFQVKNNIEETVLDIHSKLSDNIIKDPLSKHYYNHYFDTSEEK